MAPSRRTPFTLVALAAAAVLSSWNPASAPMALVLGILSAALALKAMRQLGGLPTALRLALLLSAGAVAVSAAVMIRGALAGRAAGGEPVVEGVPSAERSQALDRAAAETREAREAARKELDALDRSK